jgi:pimeloyl-ACP methyl ester carboxylesterase
VGSATWRDRVSRLPAPLIDGAPVELSAFDEAVQQFLQAYAVPRRLREARTAARLRVVRPVLVPTRWGVLSAWRLGTGPAVLLVHGWEDDNSLWSPMIDELDRRGRAVVAFDLPGHGASGGDWGVSFEGSDGIVAVTEALGPIDAVVAHSAGCGITAGAIGEGWSVERAAFVAPPLAEGDRWLRSAERFGATEEVVAAAKAIYYAAHGPARAAWHPRTAYPALDVDLLVIQSRDDERNSVTDAQEIIPLNPRADLIVVDGLTHRRTARDAGVVGLIADFVTG